VIPVSEPVLLGNEKAYVNDCLDTLWISSLGKYIPMFETAFARYVGTRHGIACSNGTTGLHMALEVLGIGPGDEVIIPDFTIVVTANVILLAGAKPVLVDVDRATACIDPALIEAAITPRTKAIMVVHMYGHPCDMDPIREIARRHRLYVIEDCCESHGAQYKGRMTGALSDIAVFSFYGNKVITSGEGGMLTTDNDEWAAKARTYRDNGFSIPRFIHKARGMNYRMTNIQAAIGLAQTEKIDVAVERKRHIAARYLEHLAGFPHVTLPVERPWARNVYWMFAILVNDSFGLGKEQVMAGLKERGVDSRSFFYPVSEQPVFEGDDPRFPDRTGSRPVSSELGRRGLYLPSGIGLTDAQVKTCAEALMSLAR